MTGRPPTLKDFIIWTPVGSALFVFLLFLVQTLTRTKFAEIAPFYPLMAGIGALFVITSILAFDP